MSQRLLVKAIGVISGTSMDGIDVSSVETDGDTVVKPGPGRTFSYPDDLRKTLQALIAQPERAQSEPLEDLEQAVTDAHIDAIRRFMAETGIPTGDVRLIGFHGQTVYHRPEVRFTRQLGLGDRVARSLGIDTVYRFRHADVASGGEGAPFVPLYHRALASRLAQPVMILNLGGVGNVTYINGDTVIAFDTGPASALLDDFVLRRRGLSFDENGQLAASGNKKPVIGGGTSYDEFVLPSMGDEVIGHVSVLQYSAALDTPKNAEFVKRYRAKYGKVPSYYSESNYTTAQMIHKVIADNGGRFPGQEEFVKQLAAVKIDTIRGPVSLDEMRNPVQSIYIKKVEKKKMFGYDKDELWNTVIKTYPSVSQFWTYKPAEFLKQPLYSRDFPPCKFCQ